MDFVYNLITFVHNMGDDVTIEAALISVHVSTDVLHREGDRLLNLLVVLHFLDMVVRVLILGRAQKVLIAQQFLPFFLCDNLLRRLLGGIEAKRGWVKGERVKELRAPVFRVHVKLESLVCLCALGLTLC